MLFQQEGLPEYPLPPGLRSMYGGGLGFQEPVLYANLVASLDGVVMVPGRAHVGSILSAHSSADRFSMALLRACADAVVIGAGTLRDSPGSLWTAERAYPRLAREFASLRRSLGRVALPQLVVVTRSGDLDPAHPALQSGPLVVAPEARAGELRGRLHQATSFLPYSGSHLDWRWLLAELKARRLLTVLSEAGPRSTGQLIELDLLNELFLTLAPTVAGEPADGGRGGFAPGVDLLGSGMARAQMLAVRRSGDHLFLRYHLHDPAR
ncbi:MAG: dihydrofolate reductase family protein [Candidatus Dormibacteria bacterium]